MSETKETEDTMKEFMPQFTTPYSREEARRIDAGVLAFVGDAVQTLYVRTRLAAALDVKSGALHRLAAHEVNATAQASALKRIESLLTEEELSVYKRSRNTHKETVAKHADVVDYKIASGFEGLIGYLYLTGRYERLTELVTVGLKSMEQKEAEEDGNHA